MFKLFSKVAAPATAKASAPASVSMSSAMMARAGDRKATYSKVFRFSPPHGPDHQPERVEIVGSFTNWHPISMQRNPQDHSWQANISGIEGNKTHHYMLLVNGHPHNDKMCDGYAVPHGDIEHRYSITTPRGPRLFLLFAQAK
jgi:hypothetical protein